MKRQFRLTRSTEFKRVRRLGRSHAHPLVVLVALKAQDANRVRIGVVAGRSVGGAVQRNKAKRRLRACLHEILPSIQPGWDLIFLARRPISEANYWQIRSAVHQVTQRAGLLTSRSNG